MGKSQKKRSMRRHNPMRVPDSHLPKGLSSASETSSKKNEILPILQKMESSDVNERKWACVAVSNLIQNDPSTRRLLQGRNVVGMLITRLTDGEEEVVVEAAGSLRNLCIDGGYDMCAEMYNKNILAPLKVYIPKISSILSEFLESPKSAPENAREMVYGLAENVITILWCLSETSNKALNAINSMNLIPFLMSFLSSRDKLSIAPVVAAAQCLYVLTDDNYPAVSEMKSNAGYITSLLEIAKSKDWANGTTQSQDPQMITLHVLATGILRNISPPPNILNGTSLDVDKDIVLPVMQPTITSVSLVDISNSIQNLVTQTTSDPAEKNQNLANAPNADHKSPAETQLELSEASLRAVQLALEVLTSTCATLPDPELESSPDEDDDIEEVEQSEDVDEEQMTVDADKDVPNNSLLPSLVPSLLDLAQPTALSFPPLSAPSIHPPTTSVLSAIHIGALECLNNIFLSLSGSPAPGLSSDREAGLKIWNSLWQALSIVGTSFGPGQERRSEFWEVAAGVLWGVAIIWKGSLPAEESQVDVLMQLCDSTNDSHLQVKCIGTLECLAQNPASVELNEKISRYLVSMLPTSTVASPANTEPLIQAVSGLIDLYSDENMPYDVNFRKFNYLEKLIDGVEGFRKAVKGIDRKKEGGKELRRRGDETRDNLVAFIQYRRSLRL